MKVKSGEKGKVKKRMINDIKDILEEINKERSQVADIVRVVMETNDDEVKKGLGVMFLVQAGLRNAKEDPGEWLYAKINNMKQYLSGTDYDMVPTKLNGIFQKTASYWTPQDFRKELGSKYSREEQEECSKKMSVISKEEKDVEEEVKGLTEEEKKIRKAEMRIKAIAAQKVNMKKSKNGFPELGLPVTSTIVNSIRVWPCPLEGCKKGFQSPRTCDAHLNRHLGYEYGPCSKCGYSNASRDSYDKHKCFVGAKTGGRKPPSRGPAAKKRREEKGKNDE